MMAFAIFFMLPLQIIAAAPAPSAELRQKCVAALFALQPLVSTPVFTSFDKQEPLIAKALADQGLNNCDEAVSFIRAGLSKTWWCLRGHKTLDKPWVQPQRLKPESPAHSVLLRNLLLKYDSHHESE